MTSCSREKTAEDTLDKVLSLLSPGSVRRVIDAPIELAVANFVPQEVPATIDPQTLARVTGAFIECVYKNGVRPARILGRRQSEAEAVFLLDAAYEGAIWGGFEGATRDAAMLGVDVLDKVFASVTAAIKHRQHRQYTNWVLQRHVACLGGPESRRLAVLVFERFGCFLGKHLRDLHEGELLQVCPDIILDHIASEAVLGDVAGSVLSAGSASF